MKFLTKSSFFTKSSAMRLSLPLTSYDILKTLALMFMVCDHLGFYFYGDDTWMRIIGRLCVPIWFFLIGYARTREIPLSLYLGAGLILAGNMSAGEYVFPLSILLTLAIARHQIDAWMRAVFKGGEALGGLFFIFLVFHWPLSLIVEYGAIGFYFTVFGAMIRARQSSPDSFPKARWKPMMIFVGAGALLYLFSESAYFSHLIWPQFFTFVVGFLGVMAILYGFKGQEMVNMSKGLPAVIQGPIKFMGRRTLEIYVLHLLVFKAIALWAYPESFALFEWEWMRGNFIEFIRSIFIV